MDSYTGLQSVSGYTPNAVQGSYQTGQLQLNQLVTEKVLTLQDAATVDVSVDDIYKSLSIGAQKILEKINQLLAKRLPDGIESVKPEDATPDKTSDTVIAGISNLFQAYADSNPELSSEELVTRFFAAARKGVEQGYGDARDTLDSLGAFEFDGVEDGISKTKSLIDQKLKELEAQKRRELGLDTDKVTDDVAETVSSGLLTQAGVTVTQDRKSLDLSA